VLRADTRIGRFVVGEGIAADEVGAALDELGADAGRRPIVASEPHAWQVAGEVLANALGDRGRDVRHLLLPEGEAAKRLDVIERAARELAALDAQRTDPIVAVGGGALGDAAGFLAAIWLRGVPLIHVPTTLVAQIDSSIGGKTAVDLPEGKNLVGAFHQPASVVVDVAFLRTLDERQRRAALAEAVKMAVLGDDALFRLLESEGASIARGEDDAWESGAVAELVERCLWAKVEIVLADERESLGTEGPGRLALNLGHTVGHGLEAATGFGPLLHGEAVAYGLRAACRVGHAVGVTPAAVASRVESVLDDLGLAIDPVTVDRGSILAAIGHDKKRASGALRWVLPTGHGVTLRTDVPDSTVATALDEVLAGRRTASPVEASA
jgi:3-dehydroquinate synthase